MYLIRTTTLVFEAQLWRTLRSRRTLVCAAIAFIPPLLAFLIVTFADDVHDNVQHVGWLAIMEVVVPILSLIAGAAVVSEEIEDRTITYLLTRPIPRPAILLGRWLACVVWISLLLLASTLAVALFSGYHPLNAAANTVPPAIVKSLVLSALLGGAVYTALFAALGAWFRHPMIIGLAYAFAIEGFLAGLPGKTQSLTIKYHLRCYARDFAVDDWSRLFLFRRGEFETGSEALSTLLSLLVFALVLGSIIVARRQYVMTSS